MTKIIPMHVETIHYLFWHFLAEYLDCIKQSAVMFIRWRAYVDNFPVWF